MTFLKKDEQGLVTLLPCCSCQCSILCHVYITSLSCVGHGITVMPPPCLPSSLHHAYVMPPPCLRHAATMPPPCLRQASVMPPPCLRHAFAMPPSCLLCTCVMSPSCSCNIICHIFSMYNSFLYNVPSVPVVSLPCFCLTHDSVTAQS